MTIRHITATAVSLGCLLWGSVVAAQVDADDEADAAEEVEEIVVTAQKPGDRRRVDTPYEDIMREQLLRELEAQRELEEEFAWRSAARVDDPSRIRFGYRPQDANREPEERPMTDLPIENQKPATLFRFEF